MRHAARTGAQVELTHVVRDDLLLKAEREGLTPALRLHGEEALLKLCHSGVDAVMCTCSTLGEAVDGIADEAPVPALRVDRPMADEAVAHAMAGDGRIAIAAALAPTLAPTRRLIEKAAREAGADVSAHDLDMGDLWALFRAGLIDDYRARIAERLAAASEQADVIVLAQASMAPALELIGMPKAPILTSPESGFAALVAAAEEERAAAFEPQRVVA